jgi:geranylgeranyl pyrophosphate synthase
VIYTVVGEDFKDWVDKKMRERTKRLAEERDMNIKMDPEIYKVFKASTSISGKSLFPLCVLTFLQFQRASLAIL